MGYVLAPLTHRARLIATRRLIIGLIKSLGIPRAPPFPGRVSNCPDRGLSDYDLLGC